MTRPTSRSTSYPSLDLEEALNRLTAMKDAIGVNGKFNRETVIVAIGYKSLSGASARAVASLVHYGLLIRYKDLYALSELGRQYLMPLREGEDSEAIEVAAIMPKLFRKVYDDYQGQVLPRQLHNILSVKYSIQSKVAPTVVKTIESTFKFAGILSDKGVVARSNQEEVKDEEVTVGHGYEQDVDFVINSAEPPIFAREPKKLNEAGVSQQNVTHSGLGWSLTVTFKKSRDLTPALRKKVRLMLETAEDLADDLYSADGENV